jgi:IMP dehydrogenase
MYIIAGTVVTAEGTKNIIESGANMVKVGIGAGATCITRMRTGVGRPQFSAVLECTEAARAAGGYVLADAGIRHPRDVALALAAGASSVMIGSWFAPTYESAADILADEHGEYVEQYGMASSRAVLGRIQDEDEFSKMKKAFFEEGSSNVKMYLKPGSESAEDIIDQVMSGVRSTCSYVDAHNLKELHEKAIIGVQSPSAYQEGQALSGNWT